MSRHPDLSTLRMKLAQAWGAAEDGDGERAEAIVRELRLPPADPPKAPDLEAVTIDEFVAVEEPGAESLLGDPDEALIPADGDVMVYGDGGAGKTTLCIDAACHLAAGDDWLGITVARPLRVLLIENEGPRPLFRAKLRRKRDAWTGSPLEGRLLVIEAPWARLTFTDPACREALASTLRELEIDVAIAGPVSRSGMDTAGTLQDVRDFMALVGDTRSLAGRRVAFMLVHHENKGGQVSGAWEGSGDTLLHVQAQGHGKTRLYVQKARWSSSHHATSLQLEWTEGEGFEVVDKPVIDDDTVAEQILAVIGEQPGVSWTKVAKATRGVGDPKRRAIRDGLFSAGRILNVVKNDGIEVALAECPERRAARLFLADDPAVKHLRPLSDAAGTQTASLWGAGPALTLRPASEHIEDAGDAAAVHTPPENGRPEQELERLEALGEELGLA